MYTAHDRFALREWCSRRKPSAHYILAAVFALSAIAFLDDPVQLWSTHLDAVLLVANRVGSGRGMVAVVSSVGCGTMRKYSHTPNLFTDQESLSHFGITRPLADEQLSEERVQRLLLTTEFLATAAILLVQSGEEPFENQEGTLLGIGLLGWCHENGWMFSPVGGVLGEGGGR